MAFADSVTILWLLRLGLCRRRRAQGAGGAACLIPRLHPRRVSHQLQCCRGLHCFKSTSAVRFRASISRPHAVNKSLFPFTYIYSLSQRPCTTTPARGSERDSLHFRAPNGAPNSYEVAIHAVGDVLEFYDSDRLFPAYGTSFPLRMIPSAAFGHTVGCFYNVCQCRNCSVPLDVTPERLVGSLRLSFQLFPLGHRVRRQLHGPSEPLLPPERKPR